MAKVTVSLIGFHCFQQSWDHALNVDGWGDEIYLKAGVQHLDSSGAVKTSAQYETPLHGQAVWQDFFGGRHQYDGRPRIRAGSATAEGFGGIRDGDQWPPYIPWTQQGQANRPDASGLGNLPLLLWEWAGPVEEADKQGTLIITPSVWEYDNGEPLNPSWGDEEAKVVKQVTEIIGGVSGVVGQAFPVVAAVGAAIAKIGSLVPGAVLLGKDIVGESGDRPIGQIKQDREWSYDPKVLLIDLSKVTTASAVENGKGPGVWSTRVEDGENIGGAIYEVYLKVDYSVA